MSLGTVNVSGCTFKKMIHQPITKFEKEAEDDPQNTDNHV